MDITLLLQLQYAPPVQVYQQIVQLVLPDVHLLLVQPAYNVPKDFILQHLLPVLLVLPLQIVYLQLLHVQVLLILLVLLVLQIMMPMLLVILLVEQLQDLIPSYHVIKDFSKQHLDQLALLVQQ
jgi:hypothetical protein